MTTLTWNANRTFVRDENNNTATLSYWGSEAAAEASLRSLRGCKDCADCEDCEDCVYCTRCSGRTGCVVTYGEAATDGGGLLYLGRPPKEPIPVVPNLHKRVLEAVTAPGHELDMDNWHRCNTAHCRAGWFVHLAGPAGYRLEAETCTSFAAMAIARASGAPVSPVRFFEDNEAAMADIRRCAE